MINSNPSQLTIRFIFSVIHFVCIKTNSVLPNVAKALTPIVKKLTLLDEIPSEDLQLLVPFRRRA